ncbi:MAG: gamma-glutamylcyclotransferase family protein [Candidatus Hodarchaeales archaeon]
MTNLFIYGSFMIGQVNHKYLKEYVPIKAILSGYRRCWPRNKDAAILIKSSLGSVRGELYLHVIERDLKRIIRLHGIPHYNTSKNVIVTTLKEKEKYEAKIFYPNDDIIRQWLFAEEKERNLLAH